MGAPQAGRGCHSPTPPAPKYHHVVINILIPTAVLYIKPFHYTHSRHHDFDSHGRFIDTTMKLQCCLIHSILLLIPKPFIFPKQNVQMSSQQPSGDSKTLIIDSQQPPADSKTIDISFTKRANVFTAALWRFQNINNCFTAASC